MEVFKVRLKNSGLVVDALFGIGLNSPVRELPGRLIGLVNGARRPVLSIDVPSGLDADSGRVLGGCIKAHTTVTFAYPKTGFRKNHGPRAVGRLIVADIF
jgi:NAD(P)H-hydrate epimerase